MANMVVVGTQWGDEGKGKITDILTEKADVVARYQGGANAGHTVIIGKDEFILHLIPSGITHPNKTCVIGAGVVVDPKSFMNEAKYLESKNISTEGRLVIDGRSTVILPYHRVLDIANEEARSKNSEQKIGTTARGIGPAYVDRYSRKAMISLDLLDIDSFRKKLSQGIEEKVRYMKNYLGVTNEDIGSYLDILTEKERKGNAEMLKKGVIKDKYLDFSRFYDKDKGFSLEGIMEDFEGISKKLAKEGLIGDSSIIINEAIGAHKKILFEGAQGTMLDVNFGTYPYVTSSNPIAGGACTGLGVGPIHIDKVIGVLKAYTTRVGSGPFPTEYDANLDEKIRIAGNEFGATTGRNRRCGHFDAVIARTAAYLNGVTDIAITKLDVLSGLDEIKICTAYKYNDKALRTIPMETALLDKVEPVYEVVKGWNCDISNCKTYDELPANAKFYVHRLKQHMKDAPGNPDIKINMISVGPKREQTIKMYD